MKIFFLSITLFLSSTVLASTKSLKISGFTDLKYSTLSKKIVKYTANDKLKNIKEITFAKTLVEILSSVFFKPLGFFDANENNDVTFYILTFNTVINERLETLECTATIFKYEEVMSLALCKNDYIRLDNYKIVLSFKELEIKPIINN